MSEERGAVRRPQEGPTRRPSPGAAFIVPPDLIKKGIEADPQLKVLEGVTALMMSFDYKLSNYIADIRTMGGTEEQNKNLASTLNGFKALGAMLAAKEPAAGDLFNAIEITSGKDFVQALHQHFRGSHGKAREGRAGEGRGVHEEKEGRAGGREAGSEKVGLLFVEIFLRPEDPAGEGEEHAGDHGQHQHGQGR